MTVSDLVGKIDVAYDPEILIAKHDKGVQYDVLFNGKLSTLQGTENVLENVVDTFCFGYGSMTVFVM